LAACDVTVAGAGELYELLTPLGAEAERLVGRELTVTLGLGPASPAPALTSSHELAADPPGEAYRYSNRSFRLAAAAERHYSVCLVATATVLELRTDRELARAHVVPMHRG
jgi:hypothetical protein